ncbi:hypothetical protein, partial [Mesorhizobium sp. M5C.F.Ca.IN.020.29.1.1]|uniref:hypothetical protein n=1 Tax=Mesorhizobium sp. M5C.F.Ca.IN.020.29.1.1 TaxID=2496770 RepID=UPI0019D13DF3
VMYSAHASARRGIPRSSLADGRRKYSSLEFVEPAAVNNIPQYIVKYILIFHVMSLDMSCTSLGKLSAAYECKQGAGLEELSWCLVLFNIHRFSANPVLPP